MNRLLCFILLFTIGLAPFNSSSQGRLDKVKGEVKKDKKSKSNSSSGSSHNVSGDNDEFSLFVLEGLIRLTYYAGYKVPFGDMEKRYFTSHPYSQENNGEYSQDNNDPNSKKTQLTISNTISIHDQNLFANKTDISYRFLPILGVKASYLQFYEDDPFDDLNMTSALLNFYRIREEYVTGYWGIGVTHVGSDVQLTGFAYNVGLDAYWGKQISTEMYWKQSFINKTPLNELKLMLNYHINKTVLSAGLVNHNLAGSNFAMLGAGIKVYLH